MKKKGDSCFKENDISSALKYYSDAILSIRYLLREGLIDMVHMNEVFMSALIVPCNLNLSLCYLKLTEELLLLNTESDGLKENLEKCIVCCEDVITI